LIKFNISAIPTLIFFKDGQLLQHDIVVEGQTLVRGGMMIGAAGEEVMRKIVKEM